MCSFLVSEKLAGGLGRLYHILWTIFVPGFYFEVIIVFKISSEVFTLTVRLLCPSRCRIYTENHGEKSTEKHGGEEGAFYGKM